MIIKSLRQLETGKRYEDLIIIWDNGSYKQPFLVLKETTREEFIKSCLDDDVPMGNMLANDKYYEIITD